MLRIVYWWKKYYVYDGLNFYGPFHSTEEARFRAPERKKYMLEKPLERFKVIEILAYDFAD